MLRLISHLLTFWMDSALKYGFKYIWLLFSFCLMLLIICLLLLFLKQIRNIIPEVKYIYFNWTVAAIVSTWRHKICECGWMFVWTDGLSPTKFWRKHNLASFTKIKALNPLFKRIKQGRVCRFSQSFISILYKMWKIPRGVKTFAKPCLSRLAFEHLFHTQTCSVVLSRHSPTIKSRWTSVYLRFIHLSKE